MGTYVAKIKEGNQVRDALIHGDTLDDARRQAARMGSVMGLKRKFAFKSSFSLSRTDRMIFLQRLAAMVSSKVGVSESLALIHETFSGSISRVAGELRRRIEDGQDLVDAMDRVGRAAFPESTIAIIRTGSAGGDTGQIIKEAIKFENEAAGLKKESSKGIWSALVGFLAGVITLFGTTLYVVPEMEASPMMSILDVGQPTWVVVSSAIMSWLAYIAAFFTVVFLLMTKVLRPAMPSGMDRLFRKIPYFRDIVLSRANHVSFYGLSVLLGAGLRIEESLRLAAESAGRGQVKEDFLKAFDAVKKGKPWAAEMGGLHPTDRAALSTSQDRQQIAEAMRHIAEQYRDMYRMRLEQLVPALGMLAAIFLTMSGAVLFGAVIIPMLEMTQAALEM